MLNRPHNIVLVDGTKKGFSLIIGCLMQKRPIDAIILHGKNTKPSPLSNFNQWMTSKLAPPVIYNQNIETVIKSLTDLDYRKIEDIVGKIKLTPNCYVTIGTTDYVVNDLITDWSWSDEVISVVIKMSSLPKETQKLILNL